MLQMLYFENLAKDTSCYHSTISKASMDTLQHAKVHPANIRES
ncbi:MAG: hypothetical protein OXC46_06180 [Thaumarchaeota archaeon]|nr:hypothetical protein [Nitrososphaerota archaeon]